MLCEHVSIKTQYREIKDVPKELMGRLLWNNFAIDADNRCEDLAVLAAGFVGEAEEQEEEGRAKDDRPSAELERDDRRAAHLPDDSRILVDARVAEVGVRETDPGIDGRRGIDV